MLLADPPPEDIVVGQSSPLLAYLRGAAQGDSVEVLENLEGDFSGEDCEWVETDEIGELLAEKGEL